MVTTVPTISVSKTISPLSTVVFEKDVSLTNLNTLGLKDVASESTQSCATRVFFSLAIAKEKKHPCLLKRQ